MALWLDKRIMNHSGAPNWTYFIKDDERGNVIIFTSWYKPQAEEFLRMARELEREEKNG